MFLIWLDKQPNNKHVPVMGHFPTNFQ